MAELLRKELSKRCRVVVNGEERIITNKEAICTQAVQQALRGNMAAFRYISKAVDGENPEEAEIIVMVSDEFKGA